MTADARKNFARAMSILKESGLLIVMGLEFPDVCRLVTNEKLKGSWWGSSAGPEIFAIGEMLSDHNDVTVTKLISGKVTFVHRQLWQQLVAVGNARDDWQLKHLTAPGKFLLKQLDQEGSLVTNTLGPQLGKKAGNVARELELKLLLHSNQFHTERGLHAKRLETWNHWAKRISLKQKLIEPSKARSIFEQRVEEINRTHSGFGRLPWQLKKK